MKHYFVKKDHADESFAQLSIVAVQRQLERGKIGSEWLVTLNEFGESYNHFLRSPRTPANWISVRTLLDDEHTRAFDTDFRPPEVDLRPGEGGLWSFCGRIDASWFWFTWLALVFAGVVAALIVVLLNYLLNYVSTDIAAFVNYVSLGVFTVASCWIGLAMQVKRWHDRNKSGWMVLINFIPIIGPIWAFIELGFLPGTKWANRFGADPQL